MKKRRTALRPVPAPPPVVFGVLSLDVAQFARNGPEAFTVHVIQRVNQMLEQAGFTEQLHGFGFYIARAPRTDDLADWYVPSDDPQP